MMSGWKSRDSVPQLVEDYLGKKVKFITHTFTLTDINQAFDVMHQGKRYNMWTETTVHAWFEVHKINVQCMKSSHQSYMKKMCVAYQ